MQEKNGRDLKFNRNPVNIRQQLSQYFHSGNAVLPALFRVLHRFHMVYYDDDLILYIIKTIRRFR